MLPSACHDEYAITTEKYGHSPARLKTKNDYPGEGQQLFAQLTGTVSQELAVVVWWLAISHLAWKQ